MTSTLWRVSGFALTFSLGVASSGYGQQQRKPPPVGEERATMVAAIQKAYPTMPAALVQLDADIRRQLDENAPCALIDWLTTPGLAVPANVVSTAQADAGLCSLPADDITVEDAKTKLGDQALRFDVADGIITVLARSTQPSVQLCCSLQNQLARIGTSDYWVSRRRLADSDEAILNLTILPPPGQRISRGETYRGPKARPGPVEAKKLAGRIVDRELKSVALGETRRLKIYLPPSWSKDRTWPALFLADGASAEFAPMVEQMIQDGQIAPIVLVSALAGESGVVGDPPRDFGADLRSAEYIRNFPNAKDRFDRHMAFFSGELVDYATTEFNLSKRREDRAVAGFSSGGVLALWAGLLHPEVFSMAVPMSPGVAPITPADLTLAPRARFWMSGGLYEPNFLRVSKSAEAVLKAGGYPVSAQYLAAGHDPTQWFIVLHDALAEMFPAVTGAPKAQA